MPFAVLLIGVILVVVAFNNSMGALASELEADIPAYFKWAAAIAAILGLGYIPGLRTPSRYLLGLVLLVVLLVNYQQIIAGFKNFLTGSGAPTGVGAGTASPSTAYATNPATTSPPTAAQITGNASGATTLVPGQLTSDPSTLFGLGPTISGIGSNLGKLFTNPGNLFSNPTGAAAK
jgi:hypothetical protein